MPDAHTSAALLASLMSQFHPEKSGTTGLTILSSFLDPQGAQQAQASTSGHQLGSASSNGVAHGLAKRVIACLDVRSNDQGDLVVTKVRRSGGKQGGVCHGMLEKSYRQIIHVVSRSCAAQFALTRISWDAGWHGHL
jgi:hypothetical protein